MKINRLNKLVIMVFSFALLVISTSVSAQRGGSRGGGGGGSRGGGGGSYHASGGGGGYRSSGGSGVAARPSSGYRPATGGVGARPGGVASRPGGVASRPGGVASRPVTRYQPQFGGGSRIGRGYYAPRAGYHAGGPGYAVGRAYYHPRYSYIGFGGLNYGYYNGFFYRPYGFGLHLIFPPFGIRVGLLPYGYYPFYWGANPYYYYGGIYYTPYADGGYQVSAPPLGALVPDLPSGYTTQVIDGQTFYQYYGTFYEPQVRDNGETWYKVVGLNGRLETGQPQYDNQYQAAPQGQQPYQPDGQQQNQQQPMQQQPSQATPAQPAAPVTGDLLFKLPDGCTTITINGEQYFQSPAGTYYQEVIGQDNKIMYQIIDKASLQAPQAAPAPTTTPNT